MSAAPDLDQLLDVLAELQAEVAAGAPLNAMLELALPGLLALLPGVSALRVYRAEVDTAALLAATDAAPADRPLEKLARPTRRADVWLAPLTVDHLLIGVLEVVDPAEAAPAASVRLLAHLLAGALRGTLHDDRAEALDYLVLASRMVMFADTPDDIIQAPLLTLARDLTAVALTLFDRPLGAESRPTAQAVIAAGSPGEGPLPLPAPNYLPQLPDAAQLDTLLSGQPVIAADVPPGLALAAPHLPGMPINWAAAFALRAGDELIGLLLLLHDRPYRLSIADLDAFTTLADQIGVTLRNHQLLSQMTASYEETRLLYEINRGMIRAQDPLDVLRALSPLGVAATLHLTVEGDALYLSHRIDAAGEQLLHLPVTTEAGWDAGLDALHLVPSADHPPDGLPPLLAVLAQHQGAASFVALPVLDRDRLTDLIVLAFDAPSSFNAEAERLYATLVDQLAIILQSQRLLRDAQVHAEQMANQVRVLETLNTLTSTVGLGGDESTLLEAGARALVLSAGLGTANAFLYDRGDHDATIVCEHPPERGAGRTIHLANLPPLDPSGAPLLLTEVEAARPLLHSLRMGALLLLPLVVEGVVVGGLTLQAEADRAADLRAVAETARGIAGQVALGLQNRRLLADTARRSEQLSRVNSFGQRALALFDLDAILELALSETAALLPVQRISVDFFDAGAGALHTVARYVDGEKYVTTHDRYPVPLQGTLSGQVWTGREALLLPDLAREPGMTGDDLNGMGSALAVPIFGRVGVLGVLTLACTDLRGFSEADAAVLRQLAAHLATAVENSAVYQQSQRAAHNEALINEISAHMQQQSDIQGMMQVAAQELGRALGARRARVRLGSPGQSEDGGEA